MNCRPCFSLLFVFFDPFDHVVVLQSCMQWLKWKLLSTSSLIYGMLSIDFYFFVSFKFYIVEDANDVNTVNDV